MPALWRVYSQRLGTKNARSIASSILHDNYRWHYVTYGTAFSIQECYILWNRGKGKFGINKGDTRTFKCGRRLTSESAERFANTYHEQLKRLGK